MAVSTPNTTDDELIYFNFYLLRSVPWIHLFKIGWGGCNPENVWGTTTSKKSVSHSVALWLCNPMDCSLPGSSVHGILQARILEWIAIHFSRAYDFYTRYLFKACESWIKEDTVNGICMITDIGILLCYSYLSPRSSNSPSAVLIDNTEKFNDLLLNTKSVSSFWFYI